MASVCRVISHNHTTKGGVRSCVEAPHGKSPACQLWWPHCGSEGIMILGCHMISQDHATKGLCDFSYHSAKFGGHRHCNSEDMILVCLVILQDHVIMTL